jgi:hypothetical protein
MKNWKTTLIGIGMGAAYYVVTSIQTGTAIPQNGAQLKALILAAAIAGLGAVSKDFNVTGKS